MGQDIHICLGRVKALEIGMTRSGNPIALLGNKANVVHYGQLEFQNYAKYEVEGRQIGRDYDLFSFLFHSCRGNIQPLLENNEKLLRATQEFIKWVDLEYANHMRLTNKAWSEQYDYGWSDVYTTGDHSYLVYPTVVLADFDYNQQVQVSPKEEWHRDEYYAAKVARYANTTYLDIFGANWINFLKYCQEENWTFLILSLDN